VRLSDAIEKGTYGLLTRGPDWDTDVYFAAFRGLYGRDPDLPELAEFYHTGEWGYGTDVEYALRLMTVFGLRWSEVIQRLRGMGL